MLGARVVAGNLFRARSESARPLAAMDSAVISDNPDQRKEYEPAGDLKHEPAVPFHKHSGRRFVFFGLHCSVIRYSLP
jgi:hypothetical protein